MPAINLTRYRSVVKDLSSTTISSLLLRWVGIRVGELYLNKTK